MAVDMFLELDGIKGETVDKAYKSKNAMDILAWSWGVSNTGTFHHGSGGGAISLREVLVGMIEEYARNMGHVDLLRERIDGRLGQ